MTIDFDARYRVDGYRGVAFYLCGYATQTIEVEYETEDGFFYDLETVEDETMVRAVMVGDDREHIIGVDELEPLEDDEFCSCCGQVGCHWN